MTSMFLQADVGADAVKNATDTLSQSVLGSLVVILLFSCGFLIKLLLKAKDEKNTVVTKMTDRLIAQADETKALIKEHTKYYEELERQTEANTKAVSNLSKTIEAHVFSCPNVDKTRFVSMRSGQGGG